MANMKVFQMSVKGHGRGPTFKLFGTIGKALSSVTHMPIIKSLLHTVQILAHVTPFIIWK